MSLNRKKVAVLGGGGFIGSHLAKGLMCSGGFDPICIDLTEEKLKRIMPSGGYCYIEADVRKESSVIENIISRSDIVIDLIAYANPSIYLEKPIDVVELNLFDNLEIAKLCMQYSKWLIQFSTCEVYGKSDGSGQAFSEDDTNLILGPVKNHRWIYSCAKQLLERMIHAWGLQDMLDYTIIRPFNFIGPEMDYLVADIDSGKPRVFPEFMSSLLYGKPMILVDGGINYRTFTYIDDAIDAIILCLNNLQSVKNEIVNVGSPCNEISIIDFAMLMKRIFREFDGDDSATPLVTHTGTAYYGNGYEDCDRRIPDIAKLETLGWVPKFNLEQTVRHCIDYYTKQLTIPEN